MTANKPTTITFKGVLGELRTAHVRTLGHREYFETMHSITQIAAGSVRDVGGKMGSNIFTIMQSMGFEVFEKLAKRLLGGMVLEGVGTVDDPFECDHFVKHTDEIYAATYAAAVELNPELFSKLNAEMGRTAPAVSAQDESAGAEETTKGAK